ncbi:MAG: CehA/McbA family metallohydrolase [Chloroflexi bacterium]|nr:CehA/McbA family metallohydrolase [Chloroflexota bacterium]
MLFAQQIVDEPDLRISVPVPVLNKTSIEPDVCLTEGGGWLIWTEQSLDGDRVCARTFSDSGFGDIVAWSAHQGIECQPAIAALMDGTIVGVHAARRSGEYRLIARELVGQSLGAETVIWRSDEGLFHPRLLAVENRVWLVFEAVDASATRLMVASRVGGAWTVPVSIAAASDWACRPALAVTPGGVVWCAYDAYQDGHYDVYIQRIDEPGAPVKVSSGGYQALQPALTADLQGRLWIAYATNVNTARRDPWWLTKWCAVRCYDGEQLYDLPEQPERDVYHDDSFQGWEFPAVSLSPTGKVVLYGQAAHTLRLATCGADGWSPLYTTDQKHWGSWKPRARIVGSNPQYVVSMGLYGAQIQRIAFDGNEGAPPLLRPHEPVPARAVTTAPKPRPTIQTQTGDTLSIYFGDLHAHSAYGDATNDVDEIYHRYRDAYGYDFATLTEHDYLDGIILSPSELATFWNIAARVSEDGRFIAMYGYEWTSPAIAEHAAEGIRVGEGHRHVVCRTQDVRLASYADPGLRSGARLLERLWGEQALVIPHHTSWAGTDWNAHDPNLQRVAEICSTHGRFEYGGNLPIGYRRDHIHPDKFVLDALAMGHRLGFVGGSDSHGLRWHATEPEGRDSYVPAGTRVGWKEDAYRTGMTAVLASDLTRDAIFDAIWQRRCYATSGVPIVLNFRVNDHLMGSELATSTPPRLTVAVKGTAGLQAVDIIRSGHPFGGMQFVPGADISSVEFELFDRIIIPGEHHYYYARVTQSDGNMAWSSPIWVDYVTHR